MLRSRSSQSIVAGGKDMWSRASGCDSTAMAIAASCAVRVIGPAARPMKGGSIGTRPRLGFSPTSPHHAAGRRIEPPISVPRWIGPYPAAPAAPAPALDPPGFMSVFHGLRASL